MTVLSIIQDVQERVKLTKSSVVMSTLDKSSKQLFALCNQSGIALAKRYEWQALKREHTFLSVAAEEQTNGLPSDWNGRFVNKTFWNRSQQRELKGPLSSREWQRLKATVTSVIFDSFRVRGGALLILPTPTAGETYAYEYITKNWALSSSSTAKAKLTADDDTTLFDEEIITLDVIWRWLNRNGLPYEEEFRLAEQAILQAMSFDGSKDDIDLSGEIQDGPIVPGVQEGSWSL